MKRTLSAVGLSAMLAMPMLAAGQSTSTTPGTGGGMGSGAGSSGTRMERHGQEEMGPEQLREVQKQLKEAGFYQGSIDGQMGEQTHEAIREYQRARGLPQTGQLDEPTKELLMAQKSQQSPGRTESSPGLTGTRGGESSGGRSSSGTGPSSGTGAGR
jgi:peptidoglycan hydrolase-like protein with peptidoglycan-binding domain